MNQANQTDIQALIGTRIDLTVVEETGSTNDDLKEAARAGAADYTVLIAKRQIGGRGREGRRFFSDGGLYLSVLLPWRERSAPFATQMAAVAVARAIERTAKVAPMVKWVNDVYVGGKKVCGILAESVVTGESRRLVVGIGVNVDTPDFPEEIKNIAGSLSCDKNALAAQIITELFSVFQNFSAEEVRRDYRALCFQAGTRLTVVKGEILRDATARGLDDALGLIVEYDDGTRETLICGEVRVKMAL